MSTSSRSEYTPDITPDVSPSPPPPTPSPIPPVFESSIHVKISLQSELWPSPTPRINLAYNDSALPQTIQLSPLATQPSQRSGRLIQGKSSSALLPFLSGHIELPSPFQLLPQSKFMVYLAGSSAPIHVEMAPLICLSSPMQSTAWLYSTELVPSFWNQLGSDHGTSPNLLYSTGSQIRGALRFRALHHCADPTDAQVGHWQSISRHFLNLQIQLDDWQSRGSPAQILRRFVLLSSL